MKIKKKQIIAVIIILAIIGGSFIFLASGYSKFIEDWGVVEDFGLRGEWRITPYAVLETGEEINLIEYGIPLRWVKHDGQYIYTIKYVLEAKATRDTIQGSFDSVRIDFSDSIFGMRRPAETHLIGNQSWYKVGWGTKTLTFPSQSLETGWQHVLTVNIPQDVDTMKYYLPKLPITHPIEWEERILHPISTDTIAGLLVLFYEDAEYYPEGEIPLEIQYYCEGVITVQGLNAITGDGKIVEVNKPGIVTTTFTIGEHQAEIDWRTSVSYN